MNNEEMMCRTEGGRKQREPGWTERKWIKDAKYKEEIEKKKKEEQEQKEAEKKPRKPLMVVIDNRV